MFSYARSISPQFAFEVWAETQSPKKASLMRAELRRNGFFAEEGILACPLCDGALIHTYMWPTWKCQRCGIEIEVDE